MLRFGVDIGGTAIKLGLFDGNKLIQKNSKLYTQKKPLEGLCREIRDMMREVVFLKGLDFSNIDAIGLAIPGTVDVSRGKIIDAHNIFLHDEPITAMMLGLTGIPSIALNDADAAALAELRYGVLHETDTAIMITIGTGVGSGLILGGKLFCGGKTQGVELGHMVFDYNSKVKCACGNYGCNDVMCSATGILNLAKDSIERGEVSLFKKRMEEESVKLSTELIVACAKQGDKESIGIFNEFIDRVATMLASVIAFLDPEMVAIGGGISAIGDFFFEPLVRLVRKKCFYRSYADIVPASVRNDAGMLGAALFCENIMQNET
ncbi:MAG: ROK family protein [Clostridia bacterium]